MMDKILIFICTCMITWSFLTAMELTPRVTELEMRINNLEMNK